VDTTPASSRGPREVFARLQQVVLQFDMDAQADLYAVDGVLEWPFAPAGLPRRVEGREAIRRVLVPLGEQARAAGHHLREYQSVVVHDSTDPEVIIAEFEVQGEVLPSGAPYQLSYIQVLRVRDGEIVTFRDYWNPQALSALLAPTETVAGSGPV
jgi:ketosteroid isomerase-like protein